MRNLNKNNWIEFRNCVRGWDRPLHQCTRFDHVKYKPRNFLFSSVTNVQEREVAQDATVLQNRITVEFSSGFISQQDFSKFIAWY